MTVSDVWDDIPTEELQDEGTKFYYLVCYSPETGEWSIDDDSIFVPEAPVFDPKIGKYRKLHLDEITRDGELMGALKAALRRIADV